ncbi:hypothetical protein F4677DRAFT_449335 [Hypoxylon crocopeplum]|nr:hypothetical protein F4677DRAFT_449335 [Hypoxylon crocopeplum]
MAADRPYSPVFGNSNQQETKPISGFIPLPPIRRTSTFDLLTKRRLGSEEDDTVPSPVGSSDNDTPPPVPPMDKGMSYQNGNGQIPSQGHINEASIHPSQSHNFTQPLPQQHPALVNGPNPNPNGFAAGRGDGQLNGFQQQVFMGGPQQQFGQMQGQSSNSGQPFNPQMAGNPIQRFPPGGQWKLEESHLSEPLKNRVGANSPPQQQPGYYAYDKETEDSAPPKGQGVSQSRPRNNSSSIPPISAERFRKHNIFAPNAPDQSHALQPQQVGHPLLRGQPNGIMSQGGRGRGDAELNKEMDVRVDEVSVSSATSEEQPRRGSGIFNLGNRRNIGAEQGPQQPDQNAAAKEKRSFFGAVTNHEKFQPKQKSNLGFPRTSTWDHDDTPEPAYMKKRLSELRGMIKGVGNAKDGAKDDQPAKPSTPYFARPSMQGPTRTQAGHQAGQGPIGHPGLSGPTLAGMGRSSTGGPRPAEPQHAQGEDEREKKHGGGFLGGLFNKQGSKSPESKQQPSPPAPQPPRQFPMQPGQEFRPGQMPPPGQQLQYPMYSSQPPIQGGILGQQGMRQPMVPGQPHPLDTIQSPSSPQFLGTAQAVMMRRPSEITVSTQNQPGGTQLSPGQRSQFMSEQSSQLDMRPYTEQDTDDRNLTYQPGEGNYLVSGALPKDLPHLSHQASQERFDAGGSSFVTRTTPNRKPVGSGLPKQDGGGSATSTPTKNPAQQIMNLARPNAVGPQTGGLDDENRLSGQLPSGQQSPTLGKLGHVRQTSNPSPGHPPLPSPPGQTSSPSAAGSVQFSPRGPSQDRQVSGQGNESSQGPANFGSSPGGGLQQNPRQNPQAWGPNSSFPNQQRPGPPYQNMQGQPSRYPGGPPPLPDQQTTISKFFGIDNGKGKSVAQIPIPKETKEKSAASKLLGAFKRSSKQSEPNQQRPPPGHQTPPHAIRPQQPGQPMSHQPGMGRPLISGPSPAGPLGPMSTLPQGTAQPGQGRGQMPPPPVPSGQGQIPPMMQGAGRGQVPPQMQIGPGQNPSQMAGLRPQVLGQQRRRSAQDLEPQYDQVPIPRGYEAVHGYGNAGMLAPSPYNIGRPSPPPAQQQFQPLVRQGAPPQQQWDPRMMQGQQPISPGQPPIQLQPGQQDLPPRSISRQGDSASASTTPTPSDQGTFLDMAPTPPPQHQQQQEEPRFDRQPAQTLQAMRGQPPQQPQVGTQAGHQRGQSSDAQTPSSSNWGSAPESARSPQSQRKQEPLVQGGILRSQPSDPNVSPPSDSDDVQRSQPQHIATAMSNVSPRPPILQTTSPQNGPGSKTARLFSAAPQPTQILSSANQTPPPVQVPEDRAGPPGASRLVSKMSAPNEASRNTSLSPEIAMNRATSVSPEPPGTRPYHQISNNSLNINVDRANDLQEDPDDDIYNATPRVNNPQTQGQDSSHENTKYAGSEKGRPSINGAVVGGVAAGAVAASVAVDAGSESSSENPTPPPGHIQMHMEPEEKILVDQPVELAAVNDDDDGIPVMSATSYPGQEWNPYGAGEFGDWE